jgi:thiol peroxidase
MRGNPLTLVSNEVKVGVMAPVTWLSTIISPVAFTSFVAKPASSLLSSLDTPVCDLRLEGSTKRPAVWVRTSSSDHRHGLLAQSVGVPLRCKPSPDTIDHRDASFGMAYGVLIKELRLLARPCLADQKASFDTSN